MKRKPCRPFARLLCGRRSSVLPSAAGGAEVRGMATKKDDQELKKEDRSASPPGWPNMPGRSLEHDGHAGEHQHDSDVTEQQRELERTTTRK